jgi:hypothetical protein
MLDEVERADNIEHPIEGHFVEPLEASRPEGGTGGGNG